jgi:hypothetical protein
MRRRDFVTASLLALPFAAERGFAAPMPVVLELFTSQGCSSCPPADAFLGELSQEAGVIGLAWHVDYWNRLGWNDPFARSEWTERQKSYASRMNEDVYTPALVVNGAAMVVGSDRAAVRHAMKEASPSSITVTLRRSAGGLEAEIGAISSTTTGLLVIYDPKHATRVDAGENQGHQLTEYRVVRDVVRLDRLTPRMGLPAIPDGRGAVLLIQDANWRVVGAADLPPNIDQ